MKLHEAIGLELERRENMSEVKIGADDLRKICRNATNPLATIELCLEWADKAEKIALAMQAEVEEQARLLGASGSREAQLLARIEALENPNKERQVFAAKMLATFTQPDVDCYLLAGIIYTAMQEPKMAGALLQEPTK